jgi:hypothetical protein
MVADRNSQASGTGVAGKKAKAAKAGKAKGTGAVAAVSCSPHPPPLFRARQEKRHRTFNVPSQTEVFPIPQANVPWVMVDAMSTRLILS